MKNRTYRYTDCEILYPFGYGLSYTDVGYSEPSISCEECGVKDSVTVTAHVTNRGNYQIQESVQVYIRHEDRADYEPGFQLKGIKNITLNPGETKKQRLYWICGILLLLQKKGGVWRGQECTKSVSADVSRTREVWN